MPRLPIIEDLTTGSVPPGSNLLVEYDPSSQWYNAHTTMAAGWIKTGGRLIYIVGAQPRETIRSQLERLGVNLRELETEDTDTANIRLRINDYYAATLSRIPQEEETTPVSLKVADLSIDWARGEKKVEMSYPSGPPGPPFLRIVDSASFLARFNEERAWVEFVLNRLLTRAQKWKQVTIVGLIEGVHSAWAYKTLEAAVDGVVDFRLEERENEVIDVVRIRSMRNVGSDRRWHKLKMRENSELVLEK